MSKGAPNHPKQQSQEQQGMQKLWDFLKNHDAVYLGNPELKGELPQFLKKNKIKQGQPSQKQKDYEKALATLIGG